MRLLGAGIIALALVANTLHASKYNLKPSRWPNANKIVVLKALDGQAAGCPVGSGSSTLQIFTARHVAEKGPLQIFDQEGRRLGEAKVTYLDPKRDLAIMTSDVGLPAIPVATAPPAKGDPVLIYGPVPNEGPGYADGVWTGAVVGIREGLMGASSGNGPGSSGSCVLSESGSVLAINTANLWWGQIPHIKQVSLSEPIWNGWPEKVSK